MSEQNCHECEHSHDCDENDNIIELTGENGDIVKVEYLATIKVEDREYAIMSPLEDEEDSGEVIIMRMEEDGEEDYLVSIDDGDELERVFEAFKNAASDEFDFE